MTFRFKKEWHPSFGCVDKKDIEKLKEMPPGPDKELLKKQILSKAKQRVK